MKNHLLFVVVAAFVIFICLAGCKKDVDIAFQPIANAGPDLFLVAPARDITIRGLATNISHKPVLQYNWRQVEGPSTARLLSGVGGAVNIVDLLEGIYSFELEVRPSNSPARDTVRVVVANDMAHSKLFSNLSLTQNGGCRAVIENFHNYVPATAAIKVFFRLKYGRNSSGNGWQSVFNIPLNQNDWVFETFDIVNGTFEFRLLCSQSQSLPTATDIFIKWN